MVARVGRWLLAIIPLCCAGNCAAQTVTARASVDSTHYVVGDWIQVRVDLTHPKGTSFRPLVGDSANGFLILHKLPVVPLSDTSSRSGFIVSRYDSALAVLPPLTFQYSRAGDTTFRTVSTNPLLLTVQTVPVDTTKDIRDVKPPLSFPISFLEILMYIGILLLIGLLIYAVYVVRKKFRKKASGAVYVPPPRPAHVIAFEELAALREKKLWQRGLIKEYYTEVTEILRRYLENRYQIKALEETTDEILSGLAGVEIQGDILRAVERILRRADLVKFAKAQPGIPEHEEMFTITHDAVDRTKPVAVVAAPAAAGTHSGA